jgi:PadR family transcriptional regulator PadR
MYLSMADKGQSANPPAPDNWDAQLRKGSLELAILASLWAEPLYGLEILRTLRSRGGMEVAEGTLYPILNRLRLDGLVTSEWRDAGTGHPRKYYTLTEPGRSRTRDMAAAWRAFSAQMDEVVSAVHSKGKKHDDAS